MITPAQAALRVTLRPTPGVPDCCRGHHHVLVNLHPLHPHSLGAAVFDTSHRRPVRVGGEVVYREVRRWTVVDASRDGRGRVCWVVGHYHPDTDTDTDTDTDPRTP